MWRGSNQGRGLAGVLLVAGAAGSPYGQQQERLLFPGALDAGALQVTVAGVLLTDPPAIYFRGPATPPPPPDAIWAQLPPGEDVRISRDGVQLLVYGTEPGGKTWFQRPPPAQKVRLDGELRFALDSAGKTTLAFAKEPDANGERVVLSVVAGQILVQRSVSGLRWISVSDDGLRFALGTSSEVLVLERAGADVLPALHLASESGALSPDGKWLALDSVEAGQARLTWLPLGTPPGPPLAPIDVQAAGSVAFSATGNRAAHVAPREVVLFDNVPQLIQRRAPPAGFSWRSAAIDAQGRLALGRIRVERRPYRDPAYPTDPFRPGSARVAVDFLVSASGAPVASTEWTVPLWNFRAPEVAFAANGSCIANTGHSVFQVEPPWPH